jgi:hypothetical protein
MRSLVAIVADTSLSDDLDLHQYCSPLMKGDHLTYKLDAEFKLCGIAELFLERPIKPMGLERESASFFVLRHLSGPILH